MIILGDEVSDALTTPIFYIKHINYQNNFFFFNLQNLVCGENIKKYGLLRFFSPHLPFFPY